MRRPLIFLPLVIATAAAGISLADQTASRRANPKLPLVTGANIQNGWIYGGAYDGSPTSGSSSDKSSSGLGRFWQSLFHASSDSNPYNADYPGIRLHTPKIVVLPELREGLRGVHISCRTSDGRTLPLFCPILPCPNDPAQHELFPAIPAAAENCDWIDIVINVDDRDQAIWRVHDLPRLFHHSLGPVGPGVVPVGGGTTLVGTASWNPKDTRIHNRIDGDFHNGRVPVNVDLAIHSTITPGPVAAASEPSHISYEIVDPSLVQEWDGSLANDGRGIREFDTIAQTGTTVSIQGCAAPRPDTVHAIEVQGAVREKAAITESVTFHDVPFAYVNHHWRLMPSGDGFTIAGLSGPKVTLLPPEQPHLVLPKSPQQIGDSLSLNFVGSASETPKELPSYAEDTAESSAEPDAILFRVRLIPGAPADVRSGSPLANRPHGMVEIAEHSVDVAEMRSEEEHFVTPPEAGPVSSGGLNGTSSDYVGMIYLKHRPKKAGHLTLTFQLNELTELRNTPFKMILPVRKVK